MNSIGRVVVVEDKDSSWETISEEFSKQVGERKVTVERLNSSSREWSNQLLQEFLDKQLNTINTSLVVLDWDLTAYQFPVSRDLIRGRCVEEQIPLCAYHSSLGEKQRLLELVRWAEQEIRIDSYQAYSDIVEECVVILDGFTSVLGAMESVTSSDREALAHSISKATGATSSEMNHLRRYMWGAGGLLQLFKKNDDATLSHLDDWKRRAATTVGYWVKNRILKFPGLVLHEAAAESYLQLAPGSLADDRVRNFFQAARYHGAFGTGAASYWWRPRLEFVCIDSMNDSDNSVPSGFDALRRRGIEVQPATCPGVDGERHLGAGYYCILSNKPVCLQHSESPGDWCPTGADRSRILSSVYEKILPWLEV